MSSNPAIISTSFISKFQLTDKSPPLDYSLIAANFSCMESSLILCFTTLIQTQPEKTHNKHMASKQFSCKFSNLEPRIGKQSDYGGLSDVFRLASLLFNWSTTFPSPQFCVFEETDHSPLIGGEENFWSGTQGWLLERYLGVVVNCGRDTQGQLLEMYSGGGGDYWQFQDPELCHLSFCCSQLKKCYHALRTKPKV